MQRQIKQIQIEMHRPRLSLHVTGRWPFLRRKYISWKSTQVQMQIDTNSNTKCTKIQMQIVQISIDRNASPACIYMRLGDNLFCERNTFSRKIPQIKVGFCSAATFLSLEWFSKAGFLKSAMVKSWTESCDAGYLSPPQQTPNHHLISFCSLFPRDLISFVSEIWSEQAPSWTARVFLFIFPKTKINSVRQIIKIHVNISPSLRWGPHLIISYLVILTNRHFRPALAAGHIMLECSETSFFPT